MMRNERSILEPFLDQLVEFFDQVVILDHGSTDGSAQLVFERNDPRFSVHSLDSDGYPQSEVATRFARELLQFEGADWVFFLDCDEFLPFRDRSELELKLQSLQDADLVYLHWRNIVPTDLDGNDIFASPFLVLPQTSIFRKIALSRRGAEKFPQFVIQQGYHGVNGAPDMREACLSEAGLLHVPVQSRLRFMSKITSSARRLIAEKRLLAMGLGSHWVKHFNDLNAQGKDKYDFTGVGLFYPDPPGDKTQAATLDFDFPYVKRPYVEDRALLELELTKEVRPKRRSGGFALKELKGLPTMPDSDEADDFNSIMHYLDRSKLSPTEQYSFLFEPLFSLPLSLPVTAWWGHIPFLFMLFKLMRPRNYVDLGVHYGASLIAAATAGRAYQIPTSYYGVDTWSGDDHAGQYEGDGIYNTLKTFCDTQFQGVELLRCYFDDAVSRFAPASIDVLHIDGLHTYDAVKHDFETWLPKVAPDGVILFHDTTVRERGFGVYKFWSELEAEYTTLQFFHSYGLGVLILDPDSKRLAPLIDICRSPAATTFYQSLTSDIASMLKMRMEYLETARPVAHHHQTNAPTVNTELILRREFELKAAKAYARALELDTASSLKLGSLFGARK